jgi:hypothetical protein
MTENKQLSEHFSFDELTVTSHVDLQSLNRTSAQAYLKQLKYTAATLEEIRSVLGEPLIISSGYRVAVLNRAVNGSPTSKHTQGLCADFRPKNMSVKEAFKVITENKDKFHSLRKAIIEGVKGKEWIHIQAKVLAVEPTEFFSTNDGKNYTEVI